MSRFGKIAYVTSSAFKQRENAVFASLAKLDDGTPVSDVVAFEVRELPISELLEIDIRVMVQAEVTKAYSQIRVPCIVEHAGLIFSEYEAENYPGGLTKPMWNALGSKFIAETKSANRRTIARAVVAYCDGMAVHTFVGETQGHLASEPRGADAKSFYWDSVFIPDDPDGASNGKTYSEIVEDSSLGLQYKVLKLSQSTRALLKFVEFLRISGQPMLWR